MGRKGHIAAVARCTSLLRGYEQDVRQQKFPIEIHSGLSLATLAASSAYDHALIAYMAVMPFLGVLSAGVRTALGTPTGQAFG